MQFLNSSQSWLTSEAIPTALEMLDELLTVQKQVERELERANQLADEFGKKIQRVEIVEMKQYVDKQWIVVFSR